MGGALVGAAGRLGRRLGGGPRRGCRARLGCAGGLRGTARAGRDCWVASGRESAGACGTPSEWVSVSAWPWPTPSVGPVSPPGWPTPGHAGEPAGHGAPGRRRPDRGSPRWSPTRTGPARDSRTMRRNIMMRRSRRAGTRRALWGAGKYLGPYQQTAGPGGRALAGRRCRFDVEVTNGPGPSCTSSGACRRFAVVESDARCRRSRGGPRPQPRPERPRTCSATTTAAAADQACGRQAAG